MFDPLEIKHNRHLLIYKLIGRICHLYACYIVMNTSCHMQICSWEFCARHHEELIPRRLLIPQVIDLYFIFKVKLSVYTSTIEFLPKTFGSEKSSSLFDYFFFPIHIGCYGTFIYHCCSIKN